MRKLSVVVVAAVLLATSSILAKTREDSGPAESLNSQIALLLSENNFLEMSSDLTAQVRFTLNNAGEIVVLSVHTDFDRMESFVKHSLNYKKVAMETIEEGKIYTLPVRVKA